VSAPPATPKRLRRLGKKLALLAASVLVALVVLEIFVRLTWTDARWVTDDARVAPGVFSARMKANTAFDFPFSDGGSYHVETNARGFPGPTVDSIASKPLKLVSIGDSFTFGWGLSLEQLCTSKFVTRYRASHPDRDLGHAIVATPGWGPRDYLFAFETEVAASKPDVVLLGFFADNDVMSPTFARYAHASDAPSSSTVTPAPSRPLWRTLDWARVQFGGSLTAAKWKLWLGVHSETYAIFEKDEARQRGAWATTLYYLAALDAAVRANGARLVILSYPSMLQVDATEVLDEGGFDSAMPDRMLASFCKEHAIEFIPLLDRLKAADGDRDLYFRKDRHIAAKGHEVVAQVLAERLAPILDWAWAERSKDK
jgi:hypothetical protein